MASRDGRGPRFEAVPLNTPTRPPRHGTFVGIPIDDDPPRRHRGGNGGVKNNPPDDPWTSENQSAFDLLSQWLDNLDLGSLSGTLKDLILQGYDDSNTIQLMLEDTDAWKTRFAGNEMRKKNGLNVLSVDQYLATENAYGMAMKKYGLPEGFYDDHDDFAKWIGNAVSPDELNERLASYSDLATRQDPAIRQQLQAMGLTKGDLMAYLIDPTRSEPLLQRQYQEVLVGAAARRVGLSSSNVEQLVENGVTEQRAIQGFGHISQELPTYSFLGDIYGEQIGESDLERAEFYGDGGVRSKMKRLASRERANFSGRSGTTAASRQESSGGLF